MARVTLHAILSRIRGSIGDLVFRRFGDFTIVSRKPRRSKVKSTPARLVVRDLFSEGVAYGKRAHAIPELWALYKEKARKLKARGKAQTVFGLSVADYRNPPRVLSINLSEYAGSPGDKIVVTARDDFKVVGVDVVITDGDGVVIEQGPAEESGFWYYTATTRVPPGTMVRVAATARDHRGGRGTMEMEIEVGSRSDNIARR